MHRLDRRILLAQGKRHLHVDPLHYRTEAFARTRAARRLRAWLRQGRVVVLQHPRWADVEGFLDQVAFDLSVDDTPLDSRVVAVEGRPGRSGPAVWSDVLGAVGRGLGAAGQAMAPAARPGFVARLEQLFRRSSPGPARPVALLIRGAEVWPLDVLEDLLDAARRAGAGARSRDRVRLVLAVCSDARRLADRADAALTLPDPTPEEALRWLAARVDAPRPALDAAVAEVGALPEALRRLVEDDLDDAAAAPVAAARRAVRLGGAALDALWSHVRAAVDGVCADDRLAERLETLADGEAHTTDPDLDLPLARAGLVTVVSWSSPARTRLRTPAIARLGDVA